MQPFLAISRAIDAFNSWAGRWLSWLIVAAVIISTVNAIVRKVFDMSSNSFLELQWVLFSIVFLMCSPWTLLNNEHIRIDIINHRLPLTVRSWIDFIGHSLFLLPFAAIMLYMAVPFFLASLRVNEQSFSAGGLPQWPAKSLIMLAMLMLLAQGISELIKRIAVMRGLMPDPNAAALSAHEAAKAEAERLLKSITAETK